MTRNERSFFGRLFRRPKKGEVPEVLTDVAEMRERILQMSRETKSDIKLVAHAKQGHIYFDLLPEIMSVSPGDVNIKAIIVIRPDIDPECKDKVRSIVDQAERRGNASIKFISEEDYANSFENFPHL